MFDLAPLVFLDEFDTFAAFTSIALIILIPLVAIIYGGLSIFIKFKGANKGIGLSLTGLWILGWILAFYTATVTVSQFSNSGRDANTIELISPPNDTLRLMAIQGEYSDQLNKDARRHNTFFRIDDDYIIQNDLSVDVLPSYDSTFKIEIIKESRGNDYDNANDNAENIIYQYEQDSTSIWIDEYFRYPYEDHWRKQEMQVNIKVPEGKTIYLHQSISHLIYDIDNVTNTRDRKMIGHYWTMTENGLVSSHFSNED